MPNYDDTSFMAGKFEPVEETHRSQPLKNPFKTISSEKGVRIVHNNVQGLRGSHESLKLSLMDSQLDIFGMSETNLNSNVSDADVDVPGYHLERKDRTYKITHGIRSLHQGLFVV